jgi:hypothetical protein
VPRARRLIEEGWRSYAERVLPTNAPRVQMVECRRAFYAGAGLLFEKLADAVGADDVSEDAGVAIMQGVDSELAAFVKDVRGGRK